MSVSLSFRNISAIFHQNGLKLGMMNLYMVKVESDEENLRLSTQYQDYIDGLSSDSDLESQRSGNVSVAAIDSEEEFDEALDYDDDDYRLY